MTRPRYETQWSANAEEGRKLAARIAAGEEVWLLVRVGRGKERPVLVIGCHVGEPPVPSWRRVAVSLDYGPGGRWPRERWPEWIREVLG